MDSYWSTVGTVVPVLALAVVIEIRAFGPRWHLQPGWIRLPQALIWIAFFSLSTYVELGALRALRPEMAPATPNWLPGVSELAVALGLCLLLLTPALEIIFRLSIPLLARLGKSHRLAFSAWLRDVEVARMDRQFRQIKGPAEELAGKFAAKGEELKESLKINAGRMQRTRELLDEHSISVEQRKRLEDFLEDATAYEVSARRTLILIDDALSSKPTDISAAMAGLVVATKKHRDDVRAYARLERRVLERRLQSGPIGVNPILPPPPFAEQEPLQEKPSRT